VYRYSHRNPPPGDDITAMWYVFTPSPQSRNTSPKSYSRRAPKSYCCRINTSFGRFRSDANAMLIVTPLISYPSSTSFAWICLFVSFCLWLGPMFVSFCLWLGPNNRSFDASSFKIPFSRASTSSVYFLRLRPLVLYFAFVNKLSCIVFTSAPGSSSSLSFLWYSPPPFGA